MGKSNVEIIRHLRSTQFDLTKFVRDFNACPVDNSSRGIKLKSVQGRAVLGFVLLPTGGSQTHFRFIIQNRTTAYGCTHTSSVHTATEHWRISKHGSSSWKIVQECGLLKLLAFEQMRMIVSCRAKGVRYQIPDLRRVFRN
jgi:hypothetical protein